MGKKGDICTICNILNNKIKLKKEITLWSPILETGVSVLVKFTYQIGV